jgi:hypothetical protein
VSPIQPVRTARVAWFRPEMPGRDNALDGTAALIDALGTGCDIEVFDARRAHEFVWKHDRQPYDLPLFELADTDDAAFIWPYLLRYPGLLVARTRSLRTSRAASLRRQRRGDDYTAELAFGGPPLLRAPFLASRLVVVPAAAHARTLQDEYPDARIRVAPLALPTPDTRIPSPESQGDPVRFGVIGRDRLEVVTRAMQRARDAGTSADLMVGEPDRVLRDADVILALTWSSADEWPMEAVAGMAAGRPVVVMETEATADWPAVDPQTWQPRDPVASPPSAVISLDPRDEEHSLMLAIRRLAADRPLRATLGAAGHAWWNRHASPDAVVGPWRSLIDEAIALAPPSEPAGWPRHLRADGSDTARNILVQFGLRTDIFA